MAIRHNAGPTAGTSLGTNHMSEDNTQTAIQSIDTAQSLQAIVSMRLKSLPASTR
jgi:hypothetical protein